MTMRSTPIALWSITLLAAWIGAALLVAAVVAPAAFAVLPSRTLAGALVGRVLPVLFWSGMLLGIGVCALSRAAGAGLIGAGASAAFAVACAIAQLYIAPKIESVRAAIGGAVDALDPSDPRRQAFGRLHGFSVLWMGVAGIGALIALIVMTRLITARSAS
ncbi:MAG: DUF4149 domain-containing protein [bacterium]